MAKARGTRRPNLDDRRDGTMHRAVFCKSCGNMIATTDGNEIKIQHRGRTIRVHGSASITCENCKEDTYIDTKCVRRLCGDNATMLACETGDARCV